MKFGVYIWRFDHLEYDGRSGIAAMKAIAEELPVDSFCVKVMDGKRRLVDLDVMDSIVNGIGVDVAPWCWPYPSWNMAEYIDEQALMFREYIDASSAGFGIVDVERHWSYSTRILETSRKNVDRWKRNRKGSYRHWKWIKAGHEKFGGSMRLYLKSQAADYMDGLDGKRFVITSFPHPLQHAIDWEPWVEMASGVHAQTYFARKRGWNSKVASALAQWRGLAMTHGVSNFNVRLLGPTFRGGDEFTAFVSAAKKAGEDKVYLWHAGRIKDAIEAFQAHANKLAA